VAVVRPFRALRYGPAAEGPLDRLVAPPYDVIGPAERDELLARTAPAAVAGEFELFKTSSIYDGTAEHPEWLGEEPARVQAAMPG
jgi:hypothetical protein